MHYVPEAFHINFVTEIPLVTKPNMNLRYLCGLFQLQQQNYKHQNYVIYWCLHITKPCKGPFIPSISVNAVTTL